MEQSLANLERRYTDEYYHNEQLLEPMRAYQKAQIEIKALQQTLITDEDNENAIYDNYPTIEKIQKLKNIKIPKCENYKLGMTPPEQMNKQSIYRYFNIIPYIPSVMINISPNWKGREITKPMIKLFKLFMAELYKDCERFDKLKYVLECGFGGDLLHAHAVAQIKPEAVKSVKTQINKGNLHRSIRKLWKRSCEGAEGIGGEVEGLLASKHSIQIQIINQKYIRDDKLLYLQEEHKPPSHKNKKHELLPWGMSYGTPFD